jgi:hypothetical protein
MKRIATSAEFFTIPAPETPVEKTDQTVASNGPQRSEKIEARTVHDGPFKIGGL